MTDEGRHGHPLPFAPMCWECWQDKARTVESQNQALQERAERAEAQEKLAWAKFDKYGWETSYGEMRTTRDAALAENQALQERIEEMEKTAEALAAENEALRSVRSRIRLLSPTQETDPE
jgi:hypothetical protein